LSAYGCQLHMQVYLTLAVALFLSAGGVYVSALTGFAQGLGMIGFLVSVPWMISVPASPATLRKRRMLFGTAAASQGLLVAPLVRSALALHPGVLFTAFAGTAGERLTATACVAVLGLEIIAGCCKQCRRRACT
jgi:FtsH-binding integral membrane protein